MTITDRYLFRTVTSTAAVVLLVMLALLLFFEFVKELEDLGEGGYGLSQVAQYLLLTVPRLLYQILPMALLVGGLMGMGALAAGNELVVMRAAGLSLLRLAAAVLMAGAVWSVVGLVLGEYVAPKTERLAQKLRAQARGDGAALTQDGGFWARDGDHFVKVGVVSADGSLGDITLYRLDDDLRLVQTIHAQRASYDDSSWTLEQVAQSNIEPTRVTTRQLTTLKWESSISPATLDILAAEPQDLALSELSDYIDYLHVNGLDARQYQLAYWLKLVAPLTNLAMLLIALPFVFAPQRSASTGQRLLIGILLGLLFILLNRALGNWVLLSGVPPIVGALLPTGLFMIAGLIPLLRIR